MYCMVCVFVCILKVVFGIPIEFKSKFSLGPCLQSISVSSRIRWNGKGSDLVLTPNKSVLQIQLENIVGIHLSKLSLTMCQIGYLSNYYEQKSEYLTVYTKLFCQIYFGQLNKISYNGKQFKIKNASLFTKKRPFQITRQGPLPNSCSVFIPVCKGRMTRLVCHRKLRLICL